MWERPLPQVRGRRPQGEGSRMDRQHGALFGYRIYRRKFWGTVAVLLVMSTAVFLGMTAFFVNTWMAAMGNEAQSRFLEREQELANIQEWATEYVNNLYGNERLMEDLAVLFQARSEAEYISLRRENSLGTASQIRYIPADIKNILFNNRNRIRSVTLRSDSGAKTIWLQNMDVCLSFDADAEADSGDIPVAVCSVRDPRDMGRIMGTMEFKVSSRDIYVTEADIGAAWTILDADGTILWDNGLEGYQETWMVTAIPGPERSGWFRDEGGRLVYYAQMESGQSGNRYIVAKDVVSAMWDNRYAVAVLLAALLLIDGAILLSSYAGIRSDANFLSLILAMLSDLEDGRFGRMQKRELPARHRETEYDMIAAALQDVGRKLEGYIETEYILKLKQQEAQMRALQHQINPHFLYNTLEMLRSKALVQGDRDTADAIAMLGTLYRTRMHKKESVLLREEFELLEMYLKIMAMRYGDKFVYQLELERAVGDWKTVVFWMQPLAENFFAHGFDRESEYNLLIVTGRERDGGVEIRMMDNGAGASPDKLPEIRRNMYEGNDSPEADIGLRNVYMRLRYFYREGFRMEIGNREEGGFFISVFLPAASAGGYGQCAGKPEGGGTA